jgi:leader peptidase (prepilin peptidase)/N-methyltransferase
MIPVRAHRPEGQGGRLFHWLLAIPVGLVLGSMINVLADDLPHHRRPQWPHCVACQHAFGLMGWSGLGRNLTNAGRCPACAHVDGWRPVLVELGMALTLVLLWTRPGVPPEVQAIQSIFFGIFLLVLVIDLEHRLILHVVTLPALAIALLTSRVTATPASAAIGAAIAFCTFLGIYLVGAMVYGSGAMGFGDVTLATFIGAATGFPLVVVALLAGMMTGGVVSFVLVVTRLRRLRSKVPYGPFLLVGAAVALLWGQQIVNWYLN